LVLCPRADLLLLAGLVLASTLELGRWQNLKTILEDTTVLHIFRVRSQYFLYKVYPYVLHSCYLFTLKCCLLSISRLYYFLWQSVDSDWPSDLGLLPLICEFLYYNFQPRNINMLSWILLLIMQAVQICFDFIVLNW
jgi:hypothetical protein